MRDTLLGAIPVLIAPVFALALMRMGKMPVIEWAVPFLAMLIAGIVPIQNRIFQVLKFLTPALAILLVINFTDVANQAGHTAAPETISRKTKIVKLHFVNESKKEILRISNPDETISEGNVTDLFPEANIRDTLEITEASPLWHSWFSKIYNRKTRSLTLWIPNGKVSDAIEKMEFRKL